MMKELLLLLLLLLLSPPLSHWLHTFFFCIQGTQADELMRDFINDICLALEYRTHLPGEVIIGFQVSVNDMSMTCH